MSMSNSVPVKAPPTNPNPPGTLEMKSGVKVLALDEPTLSLTNDEVELPEILGLSDRIYVMQHGQITGELAGSEATEESVLKLAMVDQLTEAPAANPPTTQEGSAHE